MIARAFGRPSGSLAATRLAGDRLLGAEGGIRGRLHRHRIASGQGHGSNDDKEEAHATGSLAMHPGVGQSNGSSTI
jgi:hypothetical protein